MKYLLTAVVTGSLVALAFGLTEKSAKTDAQAVSNSSLLSFSSDDGQATATLICESLFPESSGGTSPRVYRLFGAYIDSQLGMIGSALQSCGSYQTMGAQGVLPESLALELGNFEFKVRPVSGDWSQVHGESDVLAVFEPVTGN